MLVGPGCLILTSILTQTIHSHCATAMRRCLYNCASSAEASSVSNSNLANRNDISVTDEDIRRELLRLEGLRILEKLRLDKPPDIRVSLHDLPGPVTKRLEENPLGDEPITASETAEDAPGRVKNVYIVGERPRKGKGRNHMCTDRHGRPAMCIEFEINGRPLVNQHLQNATLWLHLHLRREEGEVVTSTNSMSVNLSVAAFQSDDEESTVGAAEVVVGGSGHWTGINLTEHIRQEMESRSRSHRITLLIGCNGEECSERLPVVIHHSGQHRPFLDLKIRRPDSDLPDIRKKRSRLCGPTSTSETECCLETLYVNFTEIGWHTWILQPRGYETGYCKGRCHSTATRNYNAIMKAVLQRRRNEHQQSQLTAYIDPEMAQCCSPTRMLPLEILYAKIENNHEQLSTAVLPAMIVDSCKC